jgi:hypothetical protein
VRQESKLWSESKFLLSIINKDIRLVLADPARGPGKRLEVRREFDLLRPNDLALDLVGDLQGPLILPSRR